MTTRTQRLGRARALAATLAAGALLLTGCSGGGGSPDAPKGWIADTYERNGSSSNIYRDPADAPRHVADEIEGQTKAEDRVTSGMSVYLRYDDDIVAITEHSSGGSTIEVEDYQRGVQRWHSHVGHRWSSSQSDNFRGGGPGSGK
ncbi:DUF4247 domain-containing protein [Streptomyces profundus]|uniref:DUF4247 domain-containing protein n=1 Tax=Streptomyces profundus TaxID=2867410 RepID=UPI001D16C2D5|nr:DUF4247 domain-containing protein [Streptomyces sp. MA3_2.13]UED86572.1 DUF4247 domain-containing protein [Streptomyces sp. MA3_2.13]